MLIRFHRRDTQGWRGIAGRGPTVSGARLERARSGSGRASTIAMNRTESKGQMRRLHSDTQIGRAAYGRPIRWNRAGREGTVL